MLFFLSQLTRCSMFEYEKQTNKKKIHFERFQPIWNHAHVSACEVLLAFMNDEGFFVLLFFLFWAFFGSSIIC